MSCGPEIASDADLRPVARRRQTSGRECQSFDAVFQALYEQDEVLDDTIHQMQAERRLTKGSVSDLRLAYTSRGSRPNPLPGPPRPPVGRDDAIARGLQETAPTPARSQRRSGTLDRAAVGIPRTATNETFGTVASTLRVLASA